MSYNCNTNYIFPIPIKDVTYASIIEVLQHVFEELKANGFKHTFNVTDNQATRPLKKYLKTEDCKWQFVEPSNHQVNVAEQAIQTFKNDFISGLSSTDSHWSLQFWDQLTKQA